MPHQLKRILIVSMSIVFLLQCAWFGKDEPEAIIIKPRPVEGYEALGNRIHYPRSLREENIEGTVVVSALISTSGDVVEARVVKPLHIELDQIVSNAIKRTPFEPATKNGKPTDVWISIPIVFSLSEWNSKSTPFSEFTMTVRPSPSYKSYKVEMSGHLKTPPLKPLRFECLLPFNADQPWVKEGTQEPTAGDLIQDDNGDWMVFQLSEQEVTWGFTYQPLGDTDINKFRYQFTLNHALPNWELRVIYGEQKLSFSQNPDRTVVQDDGDTRFEYDLKPMDTYESRYLELELLTKITSGNDD